MTGVNRTGASRWLQIRWSIDRVLAAVALIPAAPIAAVLAVAIRATSKGPSMVGLPRAGRHGRQFTMWKLRSMRAEVPGGQASGPSLTMTNDDRITSVGRMMRRVRVDELPQLWNIIKGEMAIIGPRPEAPPYVDLENRAWVAALGGRPGIAGPTQVMVHDWEATMTDPAMYRDEILPVKLAIDQWYLKHASPSIDWLVIVALAESLLGHRTHTVIHRRVLAEVPEAAAIPEHASP